SMASLATGMQSWRKPAVLQNTSSLGFAFLKDEPATSITSRSRRCFLLSIGQLQFSDLDISVPHFVAMVLQRDMAFCIIAEAFPGLELAVAYELLPFGGAHGRFSGFVPIEDEGEL